MPGQELGALQGADEAGVVVVAASVVVVATVVEVGDGELESDEESPHPDTTSTAATKSAITRIMAWPLVLPTTLQPRHRLDV